MTSQPSRTGSREQRLTRRLTWLAVAMGILRSRRFQDQVIVAAIVLAALAGLGRERQARAFARMLAWARKLDQQAGRAIRAPERVTSDAVKKATRHA